jgi:hypothetical protein
VNLAAPLPTHATAEQAASQPVNLHDHGVVGFFHFRHSMGFQTQLFSDKSFDEHLHWLLSFFFGQNKRQDTSCEVLFVLLQEFIPLIRNPVNSFYTFGRGTQFHMSCAVISFTPAGAQVIFGPLPRPRPAKKRGAQTGLKL